MTTPEPAEATATHPSAHPSGPAPALPGRSSWPAEDSACHTVSPTVAS